MKMKSRSADTVLTYYNLDTSIFILKNTHKVHVYRPHLHTYQKSSIWGRRGRDRMLVGFTTTSTCAISAYHH